MLRKEQINEHHIRGTRQKQPWRVSKFCCMLRQENTLIFLILIFKLLRFTILGTFTDFRVYNSPTLSAVYTNHPINTKHVADVHDPDIFTYIYPETLLIRFKNFNIKMCMWPNTSWNSISIIQLPTD